MTIKGVGIRLGIYTIVSLLAAALVVNTLIDPLGKPVRSYHAMFTDVEGLAEGSEVRIAGVRVGEITNITLRDGKAEVSFNAAERQHVAANAGAEIRYADLLGGRYLALTSGGGERLAEGATIPAQRTKPALDLTALMNGFKPLFEAIDPKETNQLAGELIAVFQGESGTVTSLLERVVSVTSELSSRDQVIGEVLRNLNIVLATMDEHRTELRDTLGQLTKLVSSVADDRKKIGEALDSGGALADSLSESLAGITPKLTNDIGSLREMTGSMVANQDRFNAAIQGLPPTLKALNRSLDYGSWVNIYVCNLSLSIAGNPVDLGIGPHSEVCR